MQRLLGEGVTAVSGFHNVAAHTLAQDVDVSCHVLVFGDDKAARTANAAQGGGVRARAGASWRRCTPAVSLDRVSRGGRGAASRCNHGGGCEAIARHNAGVIDGLLIDGGDECNAEIAIDRTDTMMGTIADKTRVDGAALALAARIG